jgi:NADPH-dependent F420 reductase
MRIAIAGGTGDIGEGLALRIAADTDHTVVIGSRNEEKAQSAVTKYESRLEAHDTSVTLSGATNEEAVVDSDLVILAIPPYYVSDTVEAVADSLSAGQVLVSPAVGMQGDEDGLHYEPPGTGSVTELVATRVPEGVAVAGAFHNLSAGRLADLEADLDLDTLVVADDADAKTTVLDLANEIEGLRALDAGPLANSAEVESITPLVINIAKYNDDMHDVGVTFH